LGRPLKWLIGGLAALAVLVLAVVLAVVLLLDPVRVRDQLVSIVREQTGRELQIAQPVDLGFFPWLGVGLRGVRLGNAPGFGDEPLASADEIRIRVKVLPLLSGHLEVDSLVLRGLALNLARTAKGEVNWSDTRPPAGAPSGGTKGQTTAAEQGLAAFLIGGVDLSGGRVAWRDQRARVGYVLDDLELKTGAIAAGLTVPFRFGARVRPEGTTRRLTLTGAGNAQLDDRLTAIQVRDLDLKARAESEGLPRGGVEIGARAGVRYDIASQALTVAPLEVGGAGLHLSGEVRGSRLADDPAFEGRLDLADAKPRALLAVLGAADVPTADPAVLGRLSAKLPFRAGTRSLSIEGLSLTLDDTAVSGRLTVPDLATGALRFDLAVDRLDLDRYLPPAGQGRPSSAAPPDTTARPKAAGALVAGGTALPVEVLRGLDVDGSLRVGALKAGGARLSELRMHVRGQAGTITQTAEARLYGGSGQSTSTIDVKHAQPAMTLKGSLQGIDLRGLLADTTGQSRLSGHGSIDADLRWSGLSETEIKRSLDGNARFALRDGALQGFDLDGLVRNALAAAQGGKAAGVAGQTRFSELTASVTAQNGVLSNRDLRATSALLGITGAGTLDLPANRIDYLARATVLESAQGQLGGQLASLRDTPIPVRFSGKLDSPAIRLDVEEVLKSGAGQQIQRKVEEKLKGEWGDKLRNILGR
jgi:AsmA protein